MKIRIKLIRSLTALLAMGANLSAAFYFAVFIFRLTGAPHPLIAFLLTCFIGYFLLLTTLGMAQRISELANRERSESNATMRESLLDAIMRMSRGDFDVFVKTESAGMYSDIAEGINDMARQLGTLENMRQDFISNVSHEIQSPLTSISGFAALLKSPTLSDERRNHYLDIIETESRRLSSLSDNLLKLSSLETGNAPLAVGEFRLDKQLETVALMLEPQWSDKNLTFEAELDRTTFYGDEGLLSQVWINLIHNAIKFTPSGGTVRLALTAADRHENGEIRCVVSDTGIGVSSGEHMHIFERFYKVDKARDRALGGNGLGLSLAKKIVELHGGSIAVSSTLGGGATFSVCFPPARPYS